MNYLSIQALASAFQGLTSLLSLLIMVWQELKVNDKLQLMGINKHHGITLACKTWVPASIPGYESKVSMAIATVKHYSMS